MIKLLRKSLIAFVLITSLTAVSGCSSYVNSKSSAGIKVTIGNDNINCTLVNKSQQSSSNYYRNIFKFAFEGDASKNIKYVKIGEKAVLNFENISPDKLTVKAIGVSSSGEQLYSDKEIGDATLTYDNGKYNILVERNIASGLSDVMTRYDFTGYLITVCKGKTENEYAFVLKTDSTGYTK